MNYSSELIKAAQTLSQAVSGHIIHWNTPGKATPCTLKPMATQRKKLFS
jgi:hypothetical protein